MRHTTPKTATMIALLAIFALGAACGSETPPAPPSSTDSGTIDPTPPPDAGMNASQQDSGTEVKMADCSAGGPVGWLGTNATCYQDTGEVLVEPTLMATSPTTCRMETSRFKRNIPTDRRPSRAQDSFEFDPDNGGYTVYVHDQGLNYQYGCRIRR